MMMMMILIEVDDGYWRSKGRIISLVKRAITCWKEGVFFAFSQSAMMICTEIYWEKHCHRELQRWMMRPYYPQQPKAIANISRYKLTLWKKWAWDYHFPIGVNLELMLFLSEKAWCRWIKWVMMSQLALFARFRAAFSFLMTATYNFYSGHFLTNLLP